MIPLQKPTNKWCEINFATIHSMFNVRGYLVPCWTLKVKAPFKLGTFTSYLQVLARLNKTHAYRRTSL